MVLYNEMRMQAGNIIFFMLAVPLLFGGAIVAFTGTNDCVDPQTFNLNLERQTKDARARWGIGSPFMMLLGLKIEKEKCDEYLQQSDSQTNVIQSTSVNLMNQIGRLEHRKGVLTMESRTVESYRRLTQTNALSFIANAFVRESLLVETNRLSSSDLKYIKELASQEDARMLEISNIVQNVDKLNKDLKALEVKEHPPVLDPATTNVNFKLPKPD